MVKWIEMVTAVAFPLSDDGSAVTGTNLPVEKGEPIAGS